MVQWRQEYNACTMLISYGNLKGEVAYEKNVHKKDGKWIAYN